MLRSASISTRSTTTTDPRADPSGGRRPRLRRGDRSLAGTGRGGRFRSRSRDRGRPRAGGRPRTGSAPQPRTATDRQPTRSDRRYDLVRLGRDGIRRQIRRRAAAIEKACGRKPLGFARREYTITDEVFRRASRSSASPYDASVFSVSPRTGAQKAAAIGLISLRGGRAARSSTRRTILRAPTRSVSLRARPYWKRGDGVLGSRCDAPPAAVHQDLGHARRGPGTVAGVRCASVGAREPRAARHRRPRRGRRPRRAPPAPAGRPACRMRERWPPSAAACDRAPKAGCDSSRCKKRRRSGIVAGAARETSADHAQDRARGAVAARPPEPVGRFRSRGYPMFSRSGYREQSPARACIVVHADGRPHPRHIRRRSAPEPMVMPTPSSLHAIERAPPLSCARSWPLNVGDADAVAIEVVMSRVRRAAVFRRRKRSRCARGTATCPVKR